MLVFRGDVVHRLHAVDASSRIRQEFHGEMDAVKLTARQLHVARDRRTDSYHDSIVTVTKLVPADILADFDVGAESGAFGLHLLDSAVEQTLVELEIRDAVAHKSADCVVTLVDDNRMACTGQLLGASQPRRAGSDDRDGHIGQTFRWHGLDIIERPRLIDNCFLIVLDHGRRLMDAEHACLLAQRRADPAGDFGEVVGHRQPVVGVLPLLLTNQIVELRDKVAQRASTHAERRAAIHAPCSLLCGPRLQTAFRVNVKPILDAFFDRALSKLATGADLQESSWISHVSVLLP